MSDVRRAAYWDEACAAKGHTGYEDSLLHRYDQPIRLALVGRALERLFPGGMRGLSVLDIGCGSGDFIALLRSRDASVMGADISAAVIHNTAGRFAGDPQVSLRVGTILDLGLPQGAFDLVTSITVLQHVVDPDEFARSLQALGNSLRAGGHMIVLELAPPHARPVEMTDGRGFVYLLERPPAHWQAAFDRAGLRVIETPVFPQLGIALLRGLGWMIDRARGHSTQPTAPSAPAASAEAPVATPGIARRALRGSLAALRRLILVLAWPFDYLLRLPLPPARFRHYRVWVLARTAAPKDS